MLNEKLEEYLNDKYYPFHMPGHKRNALFTKKFPHYEHDITEIDEFDDLNNPHGILDEIQKKCAKIYEVDHSILSVNGSTSCILAAIRALTLKNKNVLISRACHKSVYNALEINNLNATYIMPEFSKEGFYKHIDLKKLERKLAKDDFSIFVLTSETYEGYMSDVKKIRKICHKYNTLLVVDAAHSSHLGLFNVFYEKVSKYSDISIMSFHKNLSGLTQTAVMHINNEKIDISEIKRNMAIFQSSSPSYILIESIDYLIENISKMKNLFFSLKDNLEELYDVKFKNLKLIDDYNKDRTKILISTYNTNISGFDLKRLLKNEKIEIEYASRYFCLLISTVFDNKKGLDHLKNTLIKIDKKLEFKQNYNEFEFKIPEKSISIYKARTKNSKTIQLDQASNKISYDYVYSYPPAIPILAPGEIIDYKLIKKLLDSNIKLTNGEDLIKKTIRVIDKN
ncbi:MAG: aminotransferase class V-fold PLP-dependent enzyme [Tissierellia bacterium]|nr:aminotransferase class V-fold PLP-dependent enzyme [Tissierellia bacterium]